MKWLVKPCRSGNLWSETRLGKKKPSKWACGGKHPNRGTTGATPKGDLYI